MRKRLSALILLICLLTGCMQGAVLGAEHSSQDTYLNGLFQRYEKHLEGEYSVYGLTLDSNYKYSVWAEDIENKKLPSKVVLWAAHTLLNKNLNVQAYMDGLSKILSMMEKGFVQTTAIQASYSVEQSVGEAAVGAAGTTINEILGSDLLKEVGEAIKNYQNVLEIEEVVEQVVTSSGEAAVVAGYGQIYKKKIAFLTSVKMNTDNSILKEAADDMIQATSLQFACVLENYKEVIGLDALDLGWDLVNPSDMGPFEQPLRKLANELYGEKVAQGISFLSSYGRLVLTGFKIGGAVANIFYGNRMERFREMRIMEEIGDALSQTVLEYADQGLTEKDPQQRYEAIFTTVACGEALTYVRLRGEYCFMESVKDYFEATEDLDQEFEEIANQLNLYYDALSKIFPEDAGKVVVWAQTTQFHKGSVSGILGVPRVYLSGREDVADRINQSQWIQGIIEEQQAQLEMAENTGGDFDFTGSHYSYDNWVENAYAVSQAVSISMWNYTYRGGAHGWNSLVSGCFDTVTGNKLTLQDLLNEGNPSARTQLKARLMEELSRVTNQMSGMFISADTAIENFLTSQDQDANWSFTSQGFRVFLGLNSIGSYAQGNTEVIIPYQRLTEVFKPEYLPEARNAAETQGEIVICNSQELKEKGIQEEEMNVYGDGGTFAAVNTGGTFYDVSVIDETQANGIVLYYASEMDSSDLAWISDTQGVSPMQKITIYHMQQPENEWSVMSRNQIAGVQHEVVDEYQ